MIICLAGARASGKSTVAKCLADLLGWRSISFGDYVREVARERGLDPQDLAALQDIGLELVEMGWEIFCGNLLKFYNYNNGNIIVDGIRHVEAVDTLSTITKSRIILVYLEVSEQVQKDRMKQRNRGEYEGHESHKVEKQVKHEVRSKADIIIKSDAHSFDVANAIKAALLL